MTDLVRPRLLPSLPVLLLMGAACTWTRQGPPPLLRPPPPDYLLETSGASHGRAEAEDSLDGDGQPAAGGGGASNDPADRKATQVDLRAQWWSAFADPALDALMQEAMMNNPAIRDLRGLYHEIKLTPTRPNGPLWPLQIGVPVTVERSSRTSPLGPTSGIGITNNDASAGVTASYQLDVFGQLASQRRAFDDLVAIQGQSAEATVQNIAAAIAQAWFDILAERALLDLIQQQVKLNEDLAVLVKDRFELHLTTRLAVMQQQQQLLNIRAQVPLVTARLALLASQMTALLGRAPSPSTAMVPEDRRLPELPPAVLAGVPRDLVNTSPEVRQAEVRVAEAEHRLGVNRASWLPVVSLFGAAGWQTYNFQQPTTFDGQSAFKTWSFGVRLTWPIFDGGQRLTEAKQLTLTIKRRSMLYEQVFLDVVRSVQDAQIQEAKQADNVRTLRAEVELGTKVLTEARQLFEQGLSDYLSVLTALGNLSDLQRALIAAQRTLLFHRVQLYRALGGTWSQAIVDIED
jgi:NodT family efflux transporter outer membrane factor (OMF) lipoprotein